MDQAITPEDKARAANAVENWNSLWARSETRDWRADALKAIYVRVSQICPDNARVMDLGGGVGALAEVLRDDSSADVLVVDHSTEALRQAAEKGFVTREADLEEEVPRAEGATVITGTEVFEHLSERARHNLLEAGKAAGSLMISMPDNRFGPDEEPQHTIQWTAMDLKRKLLEYFEDVRVEVWGPYLLGVAGEVAKKNFTMSVTLPVRDEAADLKSVLASFRAVADQMVVGVDPRTKDDSWEIAERYADEVFFLEDPRGSSTGQDQGENGVHFSNIRNQCMERCTGDWIFMTEGHEYLQMGHDVLLCLDALMPEEARVAFVLRQGQRQQWGFPWLCRNAPDLRYSRPVHNILDYPQDTKCVQMPQVRTVHNREHNRSVERAEQRSAQNRGTLMDDWLQNQNEASLFYLAQEWREFEPSKAIEYMQEFISVSDNGVMKYQARLITAKENQLAYTKLPDGTPDEEVERVRKDGSDKARALLTLCVDDDWSRTEHWVWLGDIAFNDGRLEEAYTFYNYATTKIGQPPFTVWWIDIDNYGFLPAQRMAMVCGHLGRAHEALIWAQKVLELLPDYAPPEVVKEAQSNVELLQEAIDGIN